MQRKKKMKLESRRYTVTISGEMRSALEEHREDERIKSSIAKLIQLAVVEVYGG